MKLKAHMGGGSLIPSRDQLEHAGNQHSRHYWAQQLWTNEQHQPTLPPLSTKTQTNSLHIKNAADQKTVHCHNASHTQRMVLKCAHLAKLDTVSLV